MATRVSYVLVIIIKKIKIRLAGVPIKQVFEYLNIRIHKHLKTRDEIV